MNARNCGKYIFLFFFWVTSAVQSAQMVWTWNNGHLKIYKKNKILKVIACTVIARIRGINGQNHSPSFSKPLIASNLQIHAVVTHIIMDSVKIHLNYGLP